MKVVLLLFCVLAGVSAAKISPFVPREIVKHDVDIARVNYVKEKRDQAQALKSEQVAQIEEKLVLGGETTEKPDPDDTNTVIPIVVGSLLGGMIVVVLVSYSIVRARRAKE